MRIKERGRLACCTAMALAIAGCGGSGGGSPPGDGGGVIITPPPTSTPAPPPPQATPAFGALGQTTTQSFAVLGFTYGGQETGFGINPDLSSYDPKAAIGLRLVAPSQLVLTIAGVGEGPLGGSLSTGTDTKGRLVLVGYSIFGGGAALQLANIGVPDSYLSSTGLGSWEGPSPPGARHPFSGAMFVYGVPTAPQDVPQGGTAIFDTTDLQTLSVDFTARTVSGTIKVSVSASETKLYSLRDVVLSADGTQFSGRLTTGDPALEGSFEGRFTGPLAREMMVRYHFPSANGPIPVVSAAARR